MLSRLAGRRSRWLGLVVAMLGALVPGCGGDDPGANYPWIEEEVTFAFGTEELFGVLTVPAGEGPHPAVVLVSDSASETTGLREGTASRYFIGQAHEMALAGYAALRYDPPGVGRSTGSPSVEIMNDRVDESMAALHYLRLRDDVRPAQVGMWRPSQGSWVIGLAAAQHRDEVAFIISVSGAGISVAEQQVWGVETQTRALGLGEEDVTKAVLVAQLLVDWQLPEPLFRDSNQGLAARLPEGPWLDFMMTVYAEADDAGESFTTAIEQLASMQDEPWAQTLYLKELYLPRLRSIPPDQIEAMRGEVGESLLTDPARSLTEVRCPVLAIFGADDIVQPSERSARLFEEYLSAAGNEDVTIVVLPGVGHDIGPSTPGYSEILSDWLLRHG